MNDCEVLTDEYLSLFSFGFSLSIEACKASPDTGPCFGIQERYYYNSSSMSCELFKYGGCLGNQNNFQNERECLQRCRTEGEEMKYETHLHIRSLYIKCNQQVYSRSVQYLVWFAFFLTFFFLSKFGIVISPAVGVVPGSM